MDTSHFSPSVRDLLSEGRLFVLGSGSPNEAVRARLEKLTAENLFLPERVTHESFGRSCVAGLWLYHDFLAESHEVSLTIPSVEGDYWHGLMHLREHNYPDASYWLRKAGDHPVFAALGSVAAQLAAGYSRKIAIPIPWTPAWFIDYYRACANKKEPGEMLARQIQQREWELLFAYCYQKALA